MPTNEESSTAYCRTAWRSFPWKQKAARTNPHRLSKSILPSIIRRMPSTSLSADTVRTVRLPTFRCILQERPKTFCKHCGTVGSQTKNQNGFSNVFSKFFLENVLESRALISKVLRAVRIENARKPCHMRGFCVIYLPLSCGKIQSGKKS